MAGITHYRDMDIMIGMVVGPLLTGISTAWWKRSHNAHHVVTNSVSHDPDIQVCMCVCVYVCVCVCVCVCACTPVA